MGCSTTSKKSFETVLCLVSEKQAQVEAPVLKSINFSPSLETNLT